MHSGNKMIHPKKLVLILANLLEIRDLAMKLITYRLNFQFVDFSDCLLTSVAYARLISSFLHFFPSKGPMMTAYLLTLFFYLRDLNESCHEIN